MAARERINEEHHAAAAARNDCDAAMSGWAEANQRHDQAMEELNRTRRRLEDIEATAEKLREALEEQNSSVKAGERGRRVRRGEVAVLMTTLLPRVNFIGGSIDFAVEEVFDKRDLFATLRAFQDGAETLQSKRVASTDRWLERRFSAGRSDDGRIYFRRGNDGHYDVLISDKAAQARDIQKLKRL